MKIGEGSEVPKEPTIQSYQEELDRNTLKFKNALEQFEPPAPKGAGFWLQRSP